jgi:sec-independent protein translocase protein TatA
MEGLAPWHLLVILLVFVLFFGGKKIPEMMRGLGAGVKSFKDGMREGDGLTPPTTTPSNSAPTSNAPTEDKK